MIWFMMIKEKESHEIQSIKGQLWIPPDGVDIDERSPWHPKNQLQNLRAVKAGK
jgi:hypothetical protein